MATLQWTDGKFYDVPDDKVQQALADGFKPVDTARLAASEQPIQAAAEGVARGLTMGFGENLVKNIEAEFTGQSPEEVREQMRLRKEENPLAAGVGEVAGTLGGFVAGPAGVVTKGLGGLRAGGLAGRAAAGAAEGTLFGLGQLYSESALDDTELTGEKLAAGMASGAFTGAALDSAFYGVGKGVSGLVKKFGGGTMGDFLKSKADKISLSMIESKKWARKWGVFEEDILKTAREEGVLTKGTALSDESVALAEGAKERIWGQMKERLEQAQSLNPPDYRTLVDDVLGPIQKEYGRKQLPAVQAAIDEVQKALEKYGAQRSSYSELWDLESMWRKMASTDTIKNEILRDARVSLRDYIINKAPKQIQTASGSVDLGRSLGELNKRYAAMNAFTEGLADATQGFKSRGIMGFKEQVAGLTALGAAGGGVPGVVAAGASAAAGKYLRGRGGFMVGETLRELAESNAAGGVGKSLQKHIKTILDTAPEALGTFRATLEQAATQGAADLLDTHVQLASSSAGPQYLSALGLAPEAPGDVTVASQRMAYLGAVNAAAAEYDVTLAGAVDGLLGTKAGRKASWAPPALSGKDFKKVRDTVQGILRDPEGFVASTPADLTGSAPATTGTATATLVRGAQFLDSKLPKSPYAGMPESVAPSWEPSRADLAKFARYAEAVTSPEKVMKNLANGYMPPEQIEALQAVYPRMYQDLREKLSERVAGIQKPLTYQQRLALQPVLGPAVFGMSPQQIQIIQASQSAGEGGAGGPGGGMRKPDGRQSVDAQKNQQTQSQRLESRGA